MRPASSSSSSTLRTIAGEAPESRTKSSSATGVGPSSPTMSVRACASGSAAASGSSRRTGFPAGGTIGRPPSGRRSVGFDVGELEHVGLAGRVPAVFIVVRLVDRQDDQRLAIDAHIPPAGAAHAVIHDAVFTGTRRRPAQADAEGLCRSVIIGRIEIGPGLLLAADIDEITVDACDEFAHLD